MKNLFITIVFICQYNLLFAQSYEPIINQNKKWNILSSSINFDGPEDYLSTSSIRIGDEITINGIQYYNLQGSGFITAPIREDNNQNVFLYIGNGIETKIYDFNLEIDDEISLYDFYSEVYHTWNVINVEFVTIENVIRKKITLDFQGNEEIWLEGIGSSNGLQYAGFLPIDFDYNLLCFHNDNELLFQNGTSCNASSEPIPDINYFKTNTFQLQHFLIDNNIIELPAGEFDGIFIANQGNTNNEIEVFFNGLCGNQTSATILVNSDQSQTVLNRDATTLAQCNPNLYPNGDNQEGRFFNILTGHFYTQPNQPLPVYYEKSIDGLTLTMWNYENEKLVFNVNERLGVNSHNLKENFNIYPNPTTDYLTISSDILNNYYIEVYSFLGKKVLSEQSESITTRLDLSELTDGIYLIKIISAQESFSFEFIKR